MDEEIAFEDLAWHTRYESPSGTRSDSWPVWSLDDQQFYLYEQGALVGERTEEVVS